MHVATAFHGFCTGYSQLVPHACEWRDGHLQTCATAPLRRPAETFCPNPGDPPRPPEPFPSGARRLDLKKFVQQGPAFAATASVYLDGQSLAAHGPRRENDSNELTRAVCPYEPRQRPNLGAPPGFHGKLATFAGEKPVKSVTFFPAQSLQSMGFGAATHQLFTTGPTSC